MTEPPPPASRTSKAALASLILGALSCLCLPAIPALVLGAIALVTTGKNPQLKGRGMALTGMRLAGLFGFLSACALFAVPDFTADLARSRQSECKGLLERIYNDQRLLKAEENRYSEDVKPQQNPATTYRYLVLVSREDVAQLSAAKQAVLPPRLIERLGVTGTCPTCEFLAACVGNIDDDENLDVWAVSSQPLDGLQGAALEPGTLAQLVKDR